MKNPGSIGFNGAKKTACIPCGMHAVLVRPSSRQRLEDELAADLELPGGATIAGGEAGLGDLAEGRRLHVARRLAKVGVVEDVEGIDAQLEVEPLEELGVLLCGKVDISEAGARGRVTVHVAEAG